MKAQNRYVYGLQYDFRLPGGALLGTELTALWSIIVTPGPKVHGNFHDPNDWSFIIDEVRYPKGEILCWEFPARYSHRYTGQLTNGFAPRKPSWDRSALYNQALEKLNSKVRGNLDLAIDLAERRQTFRMIRSIRNVVSYARSGAWRSTREWANGWLQWQYGWRPLISDVYDVCDQTQRTIRRALTKVKATRIANLSGSRGPYSYPIVNGNAKVTQRCSGRALCSFQLELEARGFNAGEFASLNPVSLGWELIPYSFVVDWFIDVGSYLRNLETALLFGTIFKSGFVSELYAVDLVDDYLPSFLINTKQTDTATWWLLTKATSRRRYREFYRTKLTSYPFPRKPTFKVDLGSQRLLSAASLLRQILSK